MGCNHFDWNKLGYVTTLIGTNMGYNIFDWNELGCYHFDWN